MKFDRIPKYYYRRFQRLKGNPYALAWGFAIGVYIGITPTMPFHTISIILVTLATRTSTIAGILSSFIVCNPLTYIPIYYFSLKVGNMVTPYSITWEKIADGVDLLLHGESVSTSICVLAGLGIETLIVLLVGGFIFALPFALISYYLSLRFFIAIKKKRMEKQVLS